MAFGDLPQDDKDLFFQALEELNFPENGSYTSDIKKGFNLCNKITDLRFRNLCVDRYYKVRALGENIEFCSKMSTLESQERCIIDISFKELEEKNETDVKKYELVCEIITTEKNQKLCLDVIEAYKKRLI